MAADMMHVVFYLLAVFTANRASSKKVCSYHDILDHLNLTSETNMFKLTRPILDHTNPTILELDIILSAILAVVEKTQTFIPFIWATMKWKDEHISWDPNQFCGITKISIPKDLLWFPDLFIYEMIQKDESPRHPYADVWYDGTVSSEEDIRMVNTCNLDVHKFPFDTQRCNITIGSAMHCVEEFRIIPFSNSSRATQFSRQILRIQGEWDFIQLTVTGTNVTFYGRTWEQLVYTISMKRRPLLHVINFLLPILFFLTLDLASFFIADHRGEKLGFKVTVLLAISVLLLILNDILPAMSNKTPLIATYCIVIFALMLLSLLETILVTHLMDKDSACQEKLWLKDGCKDVEGKIREKKQAGCFCICKATDGDKKPEMLPMAEEITNNIQPGETHLLLLILEQLKELQKTLNLHLGCREEGGKFVQWAARINKAFFVFYITTVSVFLVLIFTEWSA